jgi:hypothetical protein
VADATEAVDRVGERVEEEFAIRIDEEDVLARVAAARDVEPRRSRSRQVKPRKSPPTPQRLAREAALDCAGACHGLNLLRSMRDCKTPYLGEEIN